MAETISIYLSFYHVLIQILSYICYLYKYYITFCILNMFLITYDKSYNIQNALYIVIFCIIYIIYRILNIVYH